jgi:hypothetical protein
MEEIPAKKVNNGEHNRTRRNNTFGQFQQEEKESWKVSFSFSAR